VESEGWGARLIGEQDSGSTWAGGLYSPKWTSTTYTLLLLRQLGLPPGNAQAIAACARLLDGADWYGGGLTFARSVRQPETCITSLVVGIAAAFRVEDERVGRAVGWLLDQQLPDGGWNCDSIRRGSTHGSFNTTILALEALGEWINWRGADRAVGDASRRGREFFCTHRLYR
jgi:hypothetical protein